MDIIDYSIKKMKKFTFLKRIVYFNGARLISFRRTGGGVTTRIVVNWVMYFLGYNVVLKTEK